MKTIYVYVMDTLADWELGYVTAELKSGRFFKKGAPAVSVKTVSYSRPHTSNGPGFLEMMSPAYTGQAFYKDEPSVSDANLITAGSTAPLPWAKHIIEHTGVFSAETLEAWYAYVSTGKPEHFFALMNTVHQ